MRSRHTFLLCSSCQALAMQDFEKLGVFYLGKQYDLAKKQVDESLLLYDAKDLTTHAVCVGMTGSGKTGLCLSLLEEAAIDGIPAICIDPKGDLGNLLLAFPELKPHDFAPWVDPADATRKGITVDQLAEQTAEKWREGLAQWGEDGARIARYRDAVDIAIYTPGSNAGLPITVLRSFHAPPHAMLKDADALRERINASVSGLLALLGIDADPLRSREHILLSTIIDRAWRAGRDISLSDMIRGIQQPDFDKVGVMDLESFFSAKDRFALAMQLNNLLASPGFSAWTNGETLDVQRLLFTPEGKPRVSILSIAHLSDAERMFFVTILLNEVVAWMRTQSGTSSLRAILYMDEIFGYFPPTANPPSKTPLLTLMKQARAFGLGVVLATQNPVDIDYKGLSNAGTWFLGRLQTERDKARVLEGLEGASAAAGAKFDRGRMEAILAGLGSRVFLMNNVHDDEPVVFQARWALSYLRGPLTRDQIEKLMRPRKLKAESDPTGVDGAALASVASTPAASKQSTATARPVLPPGVDEVFLKRRGALPADESLVYRPGLLGIAKVHFSQSTKQVDVWEDFSLLTNAEDVGDSTWEEAERSVKGFEFDVEPDGDGQFSDLPGPFAQVKQYGTWSSDLKDHLYRNHTLSLFYCQSLKEVSRPSESEGDFRIRISHAAREARDEQLAKLRAKYAPKLAAAQEQIRKAEQRVAKEKEQASSKTWEAAVSFGASVLSAFTGRKMLSATNISRASTSIRSASRIAKERSDVNAAQDTVEAYQQKLTDLEADFQVEVDTLEAGAQANALVLDKLNVKPKKSEINITRVVLAWIPYRQSSDGSLNRIT